VSGSYDNTLKVWDAQTGQETLTLKGHSDYVTSVSFSPDGKRIVSGSYDDTLKVWDLKTVRVSETAVPDSKKDRPSKLAATRPSVTPEEAVSVTVAHTLKAHSSSVTSVSFSPDGKRIVSGSGDNTLKVWDISMESKPK